jgi:MFS family permease
MLSTAWPAERALCHDIFLQGPYGFVPLWAGFMMAPFGTAFMVVRPASGYLSDEYGSMGITTPGLSSSPALGFWAYPLVVSSTPYWLLALYHALMGGVSGLFASPNANAVMSSVIP